MAGAGGAEVGECGADDVEGAPEVGFEDVAELGFGCVGDGTFVAVAGVGEDGVEAAELGFGLFDECGCLGGVGDIAGDGDGPAALGFDLIDGEAEFVLAAGGEGDGHSGFGAGEGGREPDAAGGTGDGDGATGEIDGHGFVGEEGIEGRMQEVAEWRSG